MQKKVNKVVYNVNKYDEISACVMYADTDIEYASILSEIDGIPVTDISCNAFLNCIALKKVVLPNSVKAICLGSFQRCVNLSKIIIPNKVNLISSLAFYGCKSLQTISIPSSVTKIGEYAFEDCKSLKTVIIPNSLNSLIKIGRNAFDGCENVQHVQFSQKLVERPDADKVFKQLFDAGLRTREVLLRIPTL